MEMTAREAELHARLEKMEGRLGAALAETERLLAETERLLAENGRLQAENKLLREKVDKLVHRIFGRSSEPERSGDRQPQAARRAQAKPKSKDRSRAARTASAIPGGDHNGGKIARLPVHQPRR